MISGLVILGSVKNSGCSRHREQASKHFSMASASVHASRFLSNLSSCTDFLWWWAVIWKHKTNKPFSPLLALVMEFHHDYSKPNWDWMFPWAVSSPSPSSTPSLSFLTVLPHSGFHDRVKFWRPWNRINVSIRHLVTVTQRYLKETLEVLYEVKYEKIHKNRFSHFT